MMSAINLQGQFLIVNEHNNYKQFVDNFILKHTVRSLVYIYQSTLSLFQRWCLSERQTRIYPPKIVESR